MATQSIAEKALAAEKQKSNGNKPKTDRKPRASKKLDLDTLKGHVGNLNLTEKVALQNHLKQNILDHRSEIQKQLELIDQTNGQLPKQEAL